MNKKLFARLASAVLTAALLLPCLTTVPTSAKGDYDLIYSWRVSDNSRATNAKIMKNNSVPRTNYVYNPTGALGTSSNYSWDNCVIYTEDGPRPFSVFAMRDTGDDKGGLPTVSTGTSRKTVEPPTIEMTEIGKYPIFPKIYDTLALTHVMAARPDRASEISMLRDDDALFIVSTNKGQSWTVGMRNWTLLGDGMIGSNYRAVFYQITSEPLVPDSVVLEKGERITGITYKPYGEATACFRGGFFMFGDLEIRGYFNREAYERDFPLSRTFTSVPEDTLRQIVVDEAWATRNTEWSTNARIRTENAAGASGKSSARRSRTIPTHTPIHGPIYQRSVLQSREGWQAFINEDGIWTGGYTPEDATGMDCSNFVYNCIARVSQTNAQTNMLYERDNNFYRLGDVKSVDDQPRYTDVDILPANSPETMYEAYALLRKGDAVNVYRDDGTSIHSRLVREDAVVVRNADGSIDPYNSYVPFIEQTSTADWYVQLPNGEEQMFTTNAWDTVFNFVDSVPGSKLLYGTFTPIRNTSFHKLYNSGYVAYSVVEYRDAQVKNPNAQFTIVPNNFEDITQGLRITAASYFRLLDFNVKLEDRNQGLVLYEYTEYGARGRYEHQIMDVTGLNNALSLLPAGDYRLTVSASTGPITTVGGSEPVASRSMDFSVSSKTVDDRQTKLNFSTSSLTAGQEVSATVELVSACDAADVEVKFDTDALTYVGGEILPESLFEDLTANSGIVRMTCVGTGGAKQLATLTFKANADVADLSKLISIKSVMTTAADAAVTANMVRGHWSTTTCASLSMADVHENAWYHDAVDFALDNGLMSGFGEGRFCPNDTLTRAQAVQILYNNEGKPTVCGNSSFPDVHGSDWFGNAVSWACTNKVAEGYGSGQFGPNDNVTLEQLAVFLHNYAGSPTASGNADKLGAHSDWAADALGWAESEGLFDGLNYQSLTGAANRAQTAHLLMNYLSK